MTTNHHIHEVSFRAGYVAVFCLLFAVSFFKDFAFALRDQSAVGYIITSGSDSLAVSPRSTVISERSDLQNSSFFTNPMTGLGYDIRVGTRKVFIEGIIGQSRLALSNTETPTS